MSLAIKKFNLCYKQDILKLHKISFKKSKSSAYWDWRFNNKFLKKPFGKIALSKKKIVSHYIVQPINYKIKNKQKNILLSLWTMTDPEYFRTNIGLLHGLIKETYELAKKRKFFLVIGFANKKSHLIFTRWFGFKQIKIMNELIKTLPINFSPKKILECTKIRKFDSTFTNFYKNHNTTKNRICTPRTSKYLNWRYLEKPDKEYKCYKILKEKELAGYFILKNYLGKKCQIIDFLATNNSDVYNTIINKSIEFAIENKLTEISLWAPKDISFYAHLKKIGFEERKMETYFIIKNLNGNQDPYVENFKNWYITMSDSDVF
jgi:hypothetical protein